MAATLSVHPSLSPCPCIPALVWAEGIISPKPSDALPAPLAELVERARDAGEALWPPERKAQVRAMLRYGKYRPSGRSRPASEFLLKAALDGRFPCINPAVEANNYISLATGLPGSIFDTEKSGETMILRRGLPQERYVFNPAGQEIDLEDLLLVARPTSDSSELGVPCGNPVKDSMGTKIGESTSRVLAVLYAPRAEPIAAVEELAAEFARLLGDWCGTGETGHRVVVPGD